MHVIETPEGNSMRNLVQSIMYRISRLSIVSLLRTSANERKAAKDMIERVTATLDGEESWFRRCEAAREVCRRECEK
jgi:hypothetical protein